MTYSLCNHHFCISTSYIESSQTLGRETNIDLNRYEVCDNVDLDTVLMEYESYYYIKFARYPKITKKLSQSGALVDNFVCYIYIYILRSFICFYSN